MQDEEDRVQQQVHPRDIRAEAASQQDVNDYADQLMKEYE